MTRSIRTIVLLAAAAFLSRCSGCNSTSDECPSGQEKCQGFCVDPASYQTDAYHCGACGISCGGGTCSAGACQCGALASCPASNPRCTNLDTDRLNCGACGNACGTNEICATGACACTAPLTKCSAGCKNLQTDPQNCGTCEHACPLANEACAAGVCECPQGTTACATACADLQTDEANCGACGTACLASQTCTSGHCCPTGEAFCNGACIDVRTDPANCGGCGTTCAAGATCAAGTCTCSATHPVVCGVAGGSAGTCCAGNGCCTPTGGAPSVCQTQHSNGVGGSFYDCLPLFTYNGTQAQAAATAWEPGGMAVPGPTLGCGSLSCLGWQTAHSCGVWCYGSDILQGRVVTIESIVCVCPTAASATWN